MKNVSIKHLQLFEDRSDAACRVVAKTIRSPKVGGMRGGHGMRIWWRWGAHAHMGRGVRNDAARRVATSFEERENRF